MAEPPDPGADLKATLESQPAELSRVHTASHTAAMLRIAQVAAALGTPAWQSQLAELPRMVQLALDLGSRVASDVSQTEFRPVTHFVGGGPARATAYEGALKLREASHLVSAEGHDVEGILHGPLVSIQLGNVVVLVAQPGPSRERMGEVETALREIGATVLSFAPPSDLDEVLEPIVNVVPLQVLAYHVSRKLWVDARPRALFKARDGARHGGRDGPPRISTVQRRGARSRRPGGVSPGPGSSGAYRPSCRPRHRAHSRRLAAGRCQARNCLLALVA